MFCVNCGSNNVKTTTQPHPKAFIERGEYNENDNAYEDEREVDVLECTDCGHEMVDLTN